MRVGVDIGGTKAAILLIDDQERIAGRCRVPTGNGRSCEEVISDIMQALEKLLEDQQCSMDDVSFIGAGVPGTVDETAQIVVHAPNLQWHHEPVGSYIRRACGKPVMLVQDTRAAAWHEARTHQGKRCVVSVTLGTGVGCGIVTNGSVWHGAFGTAGEIGHIPVVPGGRACACGRQGCMEAYASGTGMTSIARELGVAQSCEELFCLAEKQHPQALEIIQNAVKAAAMSITAMINVLSPDVICFSGGLAEQEKLYVQPLMETLRQWGYEQAVEKLEMHISSAGGDAPALGAAFIDQSL